MEETFNDYEGVLIEGYVCTTVYVIVCRYYCAVDDICVADTVSDKKLKTEKFLAVDNIKLSKNLYNNYVYVYTCYAVLKYPIILQISGRK